MDIRNLYEKIESRIRDHSFSLSEETTEMESFGRFCAVFGTETLSLQEVSCALESEELALQGTFGQAFVDSDMRLNIKITEDGRVHAAISMPQISLDSAGLFCTQNSVLTMELQEGAADFSEYIEGELSFGGIEFVYAADRREIAARRQLQVRCQKEVEAAALVNAALGLFGMDLSVFGLEETKLFELKELSFSYTAPSEWLKETGADTKQDDSFKLKIRTDIGFCFRDIFGMENVGFALEKYGNKYDLAMEGDIVIFGSRLSFFLCYGREVFSISLSECEKVRLDSADDMGILIGEKNLSKNLPSNFHPSGKPQLHTMNFAVSSDFKNIQNFNIVVWLNENWQLCESQKIIVSDIMLSFAYDLGGKSVWISGNLQFGEIATSICAGVSLSEQNSVQWRFRWGMYEDETINLTKFMGQLADALGVASSQIRLPEIEIGNAAVEYAAGTFSITLDILVTKSELFSSQTKVRITSAVKEGRRDFEAEFSWESTGRKLTMGNLLAECGAEEAVSEIPEFIRKIGLEEVALRYDFLENKISSELEVSNLGTFRLALEFGKNKAYAVSFSPCVSELSLAKLPVVGGIVRPVLPSLKNLSITDIMLYACSRDCKKQQLPAGVGLVFCIWGEKRVCMLSEKKNSAKQPIRNESQQQGSKVVWVDINQTIAIFSLYRLGVGLAENYLTFGVDASCNVSPLTFTLAGAGIGVCLTDPARLRFYISGFGVSFQNEILAIGGEFLKSADGYTGELLIKVRQISAAAIAEYSEDGSLMAFAAVTANFGGPPAFFVTGVSFGFGYHKRLILPDIDKVTDYPLIAAARGRLSREALSGELKTYFVHEPGQKFLAAGIQFTSFGIVDTNAILTVNFGNSFEIGLLGLAEMTMPPRCENTPIAYAGLALKAVVKPQEGVLSVEALLTPESYILSRDCRLSGGFALYNWFGGKNSGDMVITLGGYRRGYQKPEHYPDVPRVGFCWKLGSHLSFTGEMYFALTPKEVMAGGRLNAVYSLGNLKAYFIAAADFYLGWKPYAYEAFLQVLMGVSYRVDCWFVHHTFSIELGASFHVWGPDFAGKAHVNWYIISFDITFGTGMPHADGGIEWGEFEDSFLPVDEKKAVEPTDGTDQGEPKAAPLTIAYPEGVVSAGNRTLCRADALHINVESAIPMTRFEVNQSGEQEVGQTICIQPMKEVKLESCLQVELQDERNQHVNVAVSTVRKNLPSALWGKKGADALVRNVVCGVALVPEPSEYRLFPEKQEISMERLYLLDTIVIRDAFSYLNCPSASSYTTKDSWQTVSGTLDASDVRKRRQEFFRKQGIDSGEISLGKYAVNARNLLSEEIMIRV